MIDQGLPPEFSTPKDTEGRDLPVILTSTLFTLLPLIFDCLQSVLNKNIGNIKMTQNGIIPEEDLNIAGGYNNLILKYINQAFNDIDEYFFNITRSYIWLLATTYQHQTALIQTAYGSHIEGIPRDEIVPFRRIDEAKYNCDQRSCCIMR